MVIKPGFKYYWNSTLKQLKLPDTVIRQVSDGRWEVRMPLKGNKSSLAIYRTETILKRAELHGVPIVWEISYELPS